MQIRMNPTTQYHLSLRARHFRYLFFVEHTWSLDEIRKLIHTNLKLWGGRYNAIIPVYDNVISKEYIEVIKHYDPDFIGHTANVNPELIKNLNIFNPEKYFKLDEPSENMLQGVNAGYLMGNHINREIPTIINDNQKGLENFYSLNFCANKDTYTPKLPLEGITTIDTSPCFSICEYIVKRKPKLRSVLPMININTIVLRDESLSCNQFELIISKGSGSAEDFFYFWNRQLFIGNNPVLNQIIITEEELEILIKDKSFGELLYPLAKDQNTVIATSFTLNEREVQKIIEEKLKPLNKYIRFDYKGHKTFPFKILDANGLYERNYGENIFKQAFLSDKGLLHFPGLSFSNSIQGQNNWVVDIEVEKIGEYSKQAEKFSKHTEHQYYFNLKGRINRQNNISVYIDNTQQSLEISIPSFNQRIRQIISSPKINSKKIDTQYKDLGIGDSGARLSSFIRLFEGNLNEMGDFLEDKFWFDIIYDLSSNRRTEGNNISFNEIKSRCIAEMEKDSVQLDPATYKNEKNLEEGLRRTMNEWCEKKIFFMGYVVKCPSCSSKFWYSISEVSHDIKCKGCQESTLLPAETPFSYKLNDLVKNNICRMEASGKIQPDGNSTVVRALLSLNRKSRSSFNFSPQVDLYPSPQPGIKPLTDLDIVCEVDGKLYIGEAKYSSEAFIDESRKSLLNLIEVAKSVVPDHVIIVCTKNENSRIENELKFLAHHLKDLPITLECLITHEPSYEFASYRYFYR
ncbi:MAG: hypothetical protein Q8N66_18480 [Bacteroidota bacterium]|nr:hypothetical protein [Bacteroidota bacterium]